ncbi:MAG: hypothetical protein C0406_06460 [Sideroxydans sp.]|nr:hypothetical protein [Sideroxydans sp.]
MTGIVVTEVSPSGQADKVGIRVHDVLYKYNDTILSTSKDLAAAREVKDSGNLVAIREGKLISFAVISGALGITLVPYPIPDTHIAGVEEVFTRLQNEETEGIREKLNAGITNVITTTTHSLEGYRVIQTLEIITAEYVAGVNIFADMLAGVRDVVGGRSGVLQDSLRNARVVCLANLKSDAYTLGANAVIGVNLDYSEISGGGKSMLFLVASGTAVIVEKI